MDYNSLLSEKAKHIKMSGIRRFFDIAGQMDDVISLGVGEPDFATPWHVREAGIYSLERGRTAYTSNAGLITLREEIAGYMQRRFGLSYEPAGETLVTVGGSEAIDMCIRALVNPGDEVLIPEPCFVCYAPITELAGGVPVPIETRAEDDFCLTPDQLRAGITEKTKLLILPYPNNPTGAVMDAAQLAAIADVLRGTNVCVLSDEIYAELTYSGRHVSIASIDGMRERTVVVNGFSKAFAMTGWRLGFACGPREIILQMTKLHQYAIMCAPTTSQHAAVEALKNGDADIEYMVGEYDMRRRLILDGVRSLGLPCFEPRGAFYIFPGIAHTGLSSEEFCNRLIQEQHVAVVPGNAFGESGEGYVRISYAYSIGHIEQALERIERFLHTL